MKKWYKTYLPVYNNESANNGKFDNKIEYSEMDNTATECFGIHLFNTERKTLFQPGEVLQVSYDPRPLLVSNLIGIGSYTINKWFWSEILVLVFDLVAEHDECKSQDRYERNHQYMDIIDLCSTSVYYYYYYYYYYIIRKIPML